VAKLSELGVPPPALASGSGPGPIRRLFASLEDGLKGAPLVALAAALVWGILSVLLSPCHLSCIPLIIGFIDQQGPTSGKRACLIATAFSLGILITIALIGLVTAALGRMLGDVGALGTYVVAVVFIVVGLNLLEVIPTPWSGPGQTSMKRRGVLAAFILGLIFGVAVGPCTFAYMAPMLGVTFKVASANFLYAASLLLAYGVGHCSVIVVAGTSAELVQQYLNWNESSKGAVAVKAACGALVVAGGAYFIWTA